VVPALYKYTISEEEEKIRRHELYHQIKYSFQGSDRVTTLLTSYHPSAKSITSILPLLSWIVQWSKYKNWRASGLPYHQVKDWREGDTSGTSWQQFAALPCEVTGQSQYACNAWVCAGLVGLISLNWVVHLSTPCVQCQFSTVLCVHACKAWCRPGLESKPDKPCTVIRGHTWRSHTPSACAAFCSEKNCVCVWDLMLHVCWVKRRRNYTCKTG